MPGLRLHQEGDGRAMSDITNEMIDAAWDAYSDEVAESGVPSTQVKVAVAAALRVLVENMESADFRSMARIELMQLADEIESAS